jgi:hypothetical protein
MVLNLVPTNPSLRWFDLCMSPLKKNPNAQVDLPRTMMEHSEKNGEITMIEEWISYKWDQTICSYTSLISYGE